MKLVLKHIYKFASRKVRERKKNLIIVIMAASSRDPQGIHNENLFRAEIFMSFVSLCCLF